MTNAPTQQWQQQSSLDEGSGNTTILNGPGDHPNTGAQDPPTGTANSACHKEQLHLHCGHHHRPEDHPRLPQSITKMLQLEREALHIPTNNRIKIQVRIIRVYQITMEPPVDPPVHPRILERVLDPRKAKRSLQNLALVCLQAQVIHHKRQDHLDIQYSAQHVESTAIGAKIVLTTTSVMYARLLHTLHTCAELLNTVIHPQDHLCAYTVVKLTTD